MEGKSDIKPIIWLGDSLVNLRDFPETVRSEFGFAIYRAQEGAKHVAAKPMKGFGGAGVLEVVEDDDGKTYRAIYTVKFKGVIYVLHIFQKKSKQGSKTPQGDIELIRARLQWAQAHYAKWQEENEKR